MGLDWTALLSFLFGPVYLCFRPSSAVYIISPEISEADFSYSVDSEVWKNNLCTCWKQGITNNCFCTLFEGFRAQGCFCAALILEAASPCATLLWSVWTLGLQHPYTALPVTGAGMSSSSIVLEVVHQLPDFFLPFNLIFLTVAWSELYTSNATLGYKSVYPFHITSSKMPNSRKGGLKTCCIALTSK